MSPLRLTAPAKINLYLHVMGKRSDGYHLLDSLVAFADIGDEIILEPADDFRLSVTGPFAADVPREGNIIERAARLVCERIGETPNVHITLTKNLPVGSGVGGGSADAAATVRGLLQFFQKDLALDDLLLQLGADVPACYRAAPLRFNEIGEEIEMVTLFPSLNALLINPGVSCATQSVFKTLALENFKDKTVLQRFDNQDVMFRFLEKMENDLTSAAITQVPEIETVLCALNETDARLVRMSGSGATCFGLFEDRSSCENAALDLARRHPNWWVKAVTLNGSTP